MPRSTAPANMRGRLNQNNATLRNVTSQGEYYRRGGGSAFGNGTVREVGPGGRTTVRSGTAKS